MPEPEPDAGFAALLEYFAGCYREDSGRARLWSWRQRPVHHAFFIRGDDTLLDGAGDGVVVADARLAAALREAGQYPREREWLVGTLFLATRTVRPGESSSAAICAPLLLFPAWCVGPPGDAAVFRVEAGGPRLNVPVLEHFSREGSEPGLAEAAAALLAGDTRGAGLVAALTALLADHLPGLDGDACPPYPRLLDEAALRQAETGLRQAPGRAILAPATVVLQVERPRASEGILADLADMRNRRPAAPVAALLGLAKAPAAPPPPRDALHLPALLTPAQDQIIRSSLHAPLTFAVGPPGTGKSFTIACAALEHLARGQSVLIASRGDTAVDVAGDIIESLLGPGAGLVRGGRDEHLRRLLRWLDDLLAGALTADFDKQAAGRAERAHAGALAALGRAEARLARAIQREESLAAEIQEGGIPGWWQGLRRRFMPAADLGALMEDWLDARQLHSAAALELLARRRSRQLREGLHRHRNTLAALAKALRGRASGTRETRFAGLDAAAVLELLPLWMVNNADAHRVLPLAFATFDLVIIDEASQCDLASSLPVLQRGRRALLAGDPRQLRHISFLPSSTQAGFATAAALSPAQAERFDHRRQSLADLALQSVAAQDQVGFLHEHFRSEPEIIAFSNRAFYHNHLRIMREAPGRPRRRILELHHVAGSRDPDGVNLTEINALAAWLREHPPAPGESIGILSPFRAQADALARELPARLGTGLWDQLAAHHGLRVGTAHQWQGGERDRMLLSLALDADSAAASRRFLERPDVFNVAVTRARHGQVVFVSLEPAGLPAGSLLRGFLEAAEAPPPAPAGPAGAPAWLRGIGASLANDGYQVWPGHRVAGHLADLVVRHDAGPLVLVDVIGPADRWGAALSNEVVRSLTRAGHRVLPVALRAWQRDPQPTLARLAAWSGRTHDPGGPQPNRSSPA
jgi:hypothetical protein